MALRSTLTRAAAGALLANAVPHGVAGAVGRPFPSPFAKPPGVGLSGRVPNLVWSAANLALGTALLRGHDGSRRETVTFLVSGAAAAGCLTAYFRSLGVRPF